ncbi:MAG: hypothetical protein ACAI34_19780 [Verrucomicrobium sp.]
MLSSIPLKHLALLFAVVVLDAATLDAADTRTLTQDLKIRSMEGRYDRFFDAKPMTEEEKDAEIERMRRDMINSQLAEGEEDTEQRRQGREKFLTWVRDSKGKAKGNPYRYKITVGSNGVLCQYIAQKGGSLVEGGVSWCFEREGLMYEYSESGGDPAFITIREGTPGQATVLGVMLNEMGLLGQAAWIPKIANDITTTGEPAVAGSASTKKKMAVKWTYGHGEVLWHGDDARLLSGSVLHTGPTHFPQLVTNDYDQFYQASEAFSLPREVKYSYKGPQASNNSVITLEKVEFMKVNEPLTEVGLPAFGIAEVADVSHLGTPQGRSLGEVRYKVFNVLPSHAEIEKLRQDAAVRKETTEKTEWLKKAQDSVPPKR